MSDNKTPSHPFEARLSEEFKQECDSYVEQNVANLSNMLELAVLTRDQSGAPLFYDRQKVQGLMVYAVRDLEWEPLAIPDEVRSIDYEFAHNLCVAMTAYWDALQEADQPADPSNEEIEKIEVAA